MNGQEITPEMENSIYRYWELTQLNYSVVAKHYSDWNITTKRVETICSKKTNEKIYNHFISKQKSL